MDHLLEKCTLCPRRCSVNRLLGEVGFCGAKKDVKVAEATLHHWEEPCLSGDKGSGTVFFSYCTMRCVFCQNALYDGRSGREMNREQLGGLFLDLQRQKAHNINLVTPTHYLPQIVSALRHARSNGLSIPVVYNTSGYETVEAIALLKNYVDIFLPDFKYFDDRYAEKYSNAPAYFKHASSAVEQMVKQTGPAIFDDKGLMVKGTIIRHLALPGLIQDSKNVVRHIYDTFGDDVYISIMNQYTPLLRGRNYPELNRVLDPEDYSQIVEYARSLGVENGFIQEEGTVGESFIPNFNKYSPK